MDVNYKQGNTTKEKTITLFFYKKTSLKIGQKLRTNLEQFEAKLLPNEILNNVSQKRSMGAESRNLLGPRPFQ